MRERAELLDALGGESGCKRLAAEFYARVDTDPILRPLFPGKSLRCATEEFAAFLTQFLGGDEAQTQYRWWLSLRESHARFRIDSTQRRAWLEQMAATLAEAPLDEGVRQELRQFFAHSSAYIMGRDAAGPDHSDADEQEELAVRWRQQRIVEEVIAAIAAGHDAEALALATRCRARPSVFIGLMARMVASRRPALLCFVLDAIEREPTLAAHQYSGRTLLHFASGAGCLRVVDMLLRLGMDPSIQDRSGHTPLYAVANQCGVESGPEIVWALVRAGADANACSGVTQATPLHMAARRGYVEVARALLECGARVDARDIKGDTPLQRAFKCRRLTVAQLLRDYGASAVVPAS